MQKISSYIGSKMQKKARLLHRLTLSLRTQLPADLANHCWVANIEDRTLIICTDDPSRASLVRLQQREILKLLNQELNPTVKEYLNRIKIKISRVVSGMDLPTKAKNLSPQSANVLDECANTIKDLGIKDALKSLARRQANN